MKRWFATKYFWNYFLSNYGKSSEPRGVCWFIIALLNGHFPYHTIRGFEFELLIHFDNQTFHWGRSSSSHFDSVCKEIRATSNGLLHWLLTDKGEESLAATTLFWTHPDTLELDLLLILVKWLTVKSGLLKPPSYHVRVALLDYLEEGDQEVFSKEERLCRSESYLPGDHHHHYLDHHHNHLLLHHQVFVIILIVICVTINNLTIRWFSWSLELCLSGCALTGAPPTGLTGSSLNLLYTFAKLFFEVPHYTNSWVTN